MDYYVENVNKDDGPKTKESEQTESRRGDINRPKMNKEKIKNYIIGIILVVALIFGYMQYQDYLEEKEMQTVTEEAEKLMNATTLGYQAALLEIGSVVSQCKKIPLTRGNNTVTLIALECLNQI